MITSRIGRPLGLLLACLTLLSCMPACQGAASDAVVLKNENGMEVYILPTGATIQRLLIPDGKGNVTDVALGFDDEQAYKNGTSPYMGAIAGRVADRIANATFQLDGKTYKLYPNDGNNTLHGGKVGFDKVTWKVEGPYETPEGEAVLLNYFSKDGEEGFPGNVNATVIYTLTNNNTLITEMLATTDKDTPVNLVQHTYFNLAGHNNGGILDHVLTIRGDYYTPVNDEAIPSGQILPVAGTPFDFTTPHTIGERIKQVPGKPPAGYDHNWVLRPVGPDAKNKVQNQEASATPRLVVTLVDPKSGRAMDIYTTAPGVQFYSGNFLNGTLVGKDGARYQQHAGLALETQSFPNSINEPNFPSIVLHPGQEYRHVDEWHFYNQH